MRHYLDHASATPLRRAAAEAISTWAERLGHPDGTGDPGRIHEEGREVRQAVEAAREQVAALAGVSPSRLVFTSGATEAANAAIASALARSGVPAAEVACAAVEHSCVREAARRAPRFTELEVDSTGRIELGAVEALVTVPPGERPALVNCQWGNHELGTIQPVHEIVEMCRDAGIPSHVDAAQAFGHVPMVLDELDASYVSLSAAKMGGPAGAGALVLGRGVRLRPYLVGGSEERARRAGGENVLGIVGFGAAAEELSRSGRLDEEAERARRHSAAVMAASSIEGIELLGPHDAARRLPHVVALSISGCSGEAVLLALDRAGIAVHSGSACSSEVLEPSPVLAAIGADPDSSLRISVGWSTSDDDVAAFADLLPGIVQSLLHLRT